MTKTTDVIVPLVFRGCRCDTEYQQKTKMKSELAMISFIMSSKMADQNGSFIVKESSKSFSVFYKLQMDNRWSECGKHTKI